MLVYMLLGNAIPRRRNPVIPHIPGFDVNGVQDGVTAVRDRVRLYLRLYLRLLRNIFPVATTEAGLS